MPNGPENGGKYDSAWCKTEHQRLNKELDEIKGPTGYLTRIHQRIDNLWYLIVAVGIIGIANLIATLTNGGL